MLLSFNVEKQIITRTDTEKVVTNSMNYLYAQFTFTDEWVGEKTAVFKGKHGTYNALLDAENKCLVPWEILTEAMFDVSVFCGDLITANAVKIFTIQSGYEVGDESRIPTPDIYQQVINRLNEIEAEIDPEAIERTVDEYLADKEIVTEDDVEQIVADYIEEHKDELKGPKGDTGETGPQGPAGVGVPTGGTTGQVLTKKSNIDYDTEWSDASGGGSEKKGTLIEHHATYTEPYTSKSQYPPTITEISDTVVNVSCDGNAHEGARFVVNVLPNKTNAITVRFNNIVMTSVAIGVLFKPKRKSTSYGNITISNGYTKYDRTFFMSWDDIKDYVTEGNTLELQVYSADASSFDLSIDVHYLDGKGVLYGKTVTFLGDSITTEKYDWSQLFTLITESVKIENVAVVGANLHNFSDTVMDGNPQSSVPHSNTLPNQVQKIINNQYVAPDIVIIAIGTNGGIIATQAQIDTAYATDFAQLDLTDDAQAFRYCNEKIRNLYPNAKIIWCNPIQGATKSPQNIVLWGNTLHTLTAYGAVNNVETNRCGINQSEETVSHVNLLDGTHPNFDGSMLMALYNAAAIEYMYV